MVLYDTRRLRDAADCREIAILLGIPQEENEKKTINGETPIRFACVAPGHAGTERRYDNFAVYRHHCKCFSCGWGMDIGANGKKHSKDVFDLVKGYYENYLHKNISFEEVCGIVGDLTGGREHYILSSEEARDQMLEPFPLTSEELLLIDLEPSSGMGVLDVSRIEDERYILHGNLEDQASESRHKEDMDYLKQLNGHFQQECRYTLRDLFYSSRESFDEMVRDKCLNAARERKARYESCKDSRDTTGYLWQLRQDAVQELIKIRSLYSRLFGEEMEGDDVSVPRTEKHLDIF